MTTERENPFVGLRPFFLEDSLYFFGRETQTAELLEVLRERRFLGVVGSSGSGKSSLVRAGLIPALYGGFLVGDRDRWRIVQIKPGDSPFRNLAAGLLESFGEPAAPITEDAITALEQEIRTGQAAAVTEFIKARVTDRESVFLLVDQFEEIFAFRRMGEAQKWESNDFVATLTSLAGPDSSLPMFLALTMRTDFLGDCDLFFGLPEVLNDAQYLVPRLTRLQLRAAIEGPARLNGARIAPQLLDLLLNKLGDREDRLPVIQHALLRTWDAWTRDGRQGPIALRHFGEAGGLEDALNRDANKALDEAKAALPSITDDVVAKVFKRLTDTDVSNRAVRSPAHVSDLMAVSGADRATIDQVIRCFSHDDRNFVFASSAPDPRVDISHESLIRQWAQLRKWVDEERDARDQFKALVARARSGEKHHVMLQGAELHSAASWWRAAAPSPAWAERYSVAADDFAVAHLYLAESARARRRDRISRWAAAALVIAAIAGSLTYVQRTRAATAEKTESLRDMENQATILLERDPESAIIAGLFAAKAHAELYPNQNLPVTLESILLNAWQGSAIAKFRHAAFDGEPVYAMLSNNGRYLVLGGLGSKDGEFSSMAYDLEAGRSIGSLVGGGNPEDCSVVSPDGRVLTSMGPYQFVQWTFATRAVPNLTRPSPPNTKFVNCAFSDDGSRLALVTNRPSTGEFILTLATLVNGGRLTEIRHVSLPSVKAIGTMAFSAKGTGIVLAGEPLTGGHGMLAVFDANTGAHKRTFITKNGISTVALSPDNGLVASVEDAYSFAVFLRPVKGEDDAAMLPNSGSDDYYASLTFSPGGDRLVGTNGVTANVWDTTNGLNLGTLRGHDRPIFAAVFDARGQLVTAGQNGDVRYWRAGAPEELAIDPREAVYSAAFADEGRSVVTSAAGADGSTVNGWSTADTSHPLPQKFQIKHPAIIALSPDGRLVAGLNLEGKLVLLDAHSGKRLAETEGGPPTARLAFSPDGRRLGVADDDSTRIWTLPASIAGPFDMPQPLSIPGIPQVEDAGVANIVSFSPEPDGRQLATVAGHRVFLRNAITGKCDGQLDTRADVTSFAYALDGVNLVTGDALGRVRFWPLAQMRGASCDPKQTLPQVTAVPYQEHHGEVRYIAFSSDGKRFATASADRTVKVWDAATRTVLLTYRHASPVNAVSFSSDGTRVLAVTENDGARVWEMPANGKVTAAARARLTRDTLTVDECQRLFPGKHCPAIPR